MSKSYFLSYSQTYEHLKEPFKRLIQSLGFGSVYVFDHPDQEGVNKVIAEELKARDAVVVLYGPPRKAGGR